MGTQQSPTDGAFQGFQDPTTGNSDLNASAFLFNQLMGKVWTATIVQVAAVTNAGGVAAVGFVDVQPLVHQVDGAGKSTPHGIIHNLPYFRLQGGTDAIILDPKVGDIGAALVVSRDISAVKSTRGPNVPGSSRRFSPSDGLYLGGWLNGLPAQYVRFAAGLVEIVGTSVINVTAPTVNVNAATHATVTSPHVDLISADVNLGGTGGKKVVLDGDPVIGGGGGTVQASSSKVKAV